MKQLRIVILGDWKNYLSYFLMGSMEGAIRNGAWVRPVSLLDQNLNDIESQIKWFDPHILLCHCVFGKDSHRREQIFDVLKKIRKNGTKIFYHMGDARTEPRYKGDISEFIDFGLMNHGLVKEFANIWKVPVYHWPYACLYQKEIMEKEEKFSESVVFTGGLGGEVHEERTKFINKLKERTKVIVYPNEEIGNTRIQTAAVAASADCVLGVQMRDDIPLYLDVRPYQYIGAGALFFHDNSKAIRKIFRDKKHYVEYKKGDVDDFIEKWEYYIIEHPEKGDEIRREGFQFCQTFHSTKERMGFVIDLAEDRKPNMGLYLKDLPG